MYNFVLSGQIFFKHIFFLNIWFFGKHVVATIHGKYQFMALTRNMDNTQELVYVYGTATANRGHMSTMTHLYNLR
jgi:hypothetical protein